ncbi:MAG: MYG1 family protein [Desulfuromonadales bacterium]
MYKIVTHPGSVHKDDFLSTCVLLATLDGAQVFRREATGTDLADPNTYVVDVGLELAPERHNFDHHQDHSLPCAFHLVMKFLGYHEAAMMVFAWYPHMSIMDVRGPYQTADELGVDSSIFFVSSSPIDGYIFSKFAEVDSLTESESLYVLMKELGKDMIAMIDRKMRRLDRLKKEARVIAVKQYKAVVSDIREFPKLAMELYLRHLTDERIVMSITPSNRGEGWELLRLGDNRMVDFRAISESPNIRFVHSSGFLAKTHAFLPVPEVLALASRAIMD